MSEPRRDPEPSALRDYVRWHEAYQDPESSLSIRLRHVQQTIVDWYGRVDGDVRVMSSCAGQGDDILGVLEAHPKLRERTHGTLIELLPENARVAQRRIDALDVDLQVVVGDASITDSYENAVPADLVLLSGIMGNISDEDIHTLIAAAPQFCAPGATVIWTRGSHDPDPGEKIRKWFREAGFEEVAFNSYLDGTKMRVGVNQLVSAPKTLESGHKLFTFLR